MPVIALGKYEFEMRDAQENFGGPIVTYWNWIDHLMFCAPLAFPLPPDMPFGAAINEVLSGCYSAHPEWDKIDWDTVEWTLDGEPFAPDMEKGLADNGLGHKSVVRFVTPGLTGIDGSST